jgi:hypothetical protein
VADDLGGEPCRDRFRVSVRTGMIPIINAMMVARRSPRPGVIQGHVPLPRDRGM